MELGKVFVSATLGSPIPAPLPSPAAAIKISLCSHNGQHWDDPTALAAPSLQRCGFAQLNPSPRPPLPHCLPSSAHQQLLGSKLLSPHALIPPLRCPWRRSGLRFEAQTLIALGRGCISMQAAPPQHLRLAELLIPHPSSPPFTNHPLTAFIGWGSLSPGCTERCRQQLCSCSEVLLSTLRTQPCCSVPAASPAFPRELSRLRAEQQRLPAEPSVSSPSSSPCSTCCLFRPPSRPHPSSRSRGGAQRLTAPVGAAWRADSRVPRARVAACVLTAVAVRRRAAGDLMRADTELLGPQFCLSHPLVAARSVAEGPRCRTWHRLVGAEAPRLHERLG